MFAFISSWFGLGLRIQAKLLSHSRKEAARYRELLKVLKLQKTSFVGQSPELGQSPSHSYSYQM
jgi:hypothetical protein